MIKNTEKISKIVLYFGVIIMIFCMFAIGHHDYLCVARWGYDLLDSIRIGKISSFPEYTYKIHGFATNYSMFSNFIVAIGLLPLFIIDHLFLLSLSIEVYYILFKIWVFISVLLSLKLFYELIKSLNFSKNQILIGMDLFVTSSVLLIQIVGRGQIDNLSLIFLLIAAKYFCEKKYCRMSLMLGFSILIKPFSILIAVPILLLLISEKRQNVVGYFITMILPYICDSLFVHAVMPSYYKYKEFTTLELKRAFKVSLIDDLFRDNNGVISWLFASIIIICFVCYYLGLHKKVKNWHYIFFPTLLFVAYGGLASVSSYWFIRILPFLIIMGISTNEINSTLFLNIGVNFGCLVDLIVKENIFAPHIDCSIFNILIRETRPFWTDIFNEYSKKICLVSTTIFVICMLLIIAMYFKYNKAKEKLSEESFTVYDNILLLLQPLPVTIYIMVSIFYFLLNK